MCDHLVSYLFTVCENTNSWKKFFLFLHRFSECHWPDSQYRNCTHGMKHWILDLISISDYDGDAVHLRHADCSLGWINCDDNWKVETEAFRRSRWFILCLFLSKRVIEIDDQTHPICTAEVTLLLVYWFRVAVYTIIVNEKLRINNESGESKTADQDNYAREEWLCCSVEGERPEMTRNAWGRIGKWNKIIIEVGFAHPVSIIWLRLPSFRANGHDFHVFCLVKIDCSWIEWTELRWQLPVSLSPLNKILSYFGVAE